jgi:hypothetical protein
MRTSLLVALFAAVSLVPAAASADVTVTFVHPEHFTDANLNGRYGGDKGREPALRTIAQDLQQLGQRYLPAGVTLTVEILDVDLAGRLEPWHAISYATRYMRDVTWPRIKLRYRLDGPGLDRRGLGGPGLGGSAQPIAGEETISDPMYLTHRTPRDVGEPMPYEKAMLEDWFRARFVARASPQG